MIDVTGVDMVRFAQKAYALSVPQGLGFLHYLAGPLSEAEARACMEEGRLALSMDYVHGRACKMNVFRDGDKLSIYDNWYDHTDAQLAELLAEFGISRPAAGEHGPSCACRDCNKKRGERP